MYSSDVLELFRLNSIILFSKANDADEREDVAIGLLLHAGVLFEETATQGSHCFKFETFEAFVLDEIELAQIIYSAFMATKKEAHAIARASEI